MRPVAHARAARAVVNACPSTRPGSGSTSRLLRASRALGLLLPLVLSLVLGNAVAESGAGIGPLEQRVKAASLFRFLSYVDWPPQAAGQDAYRIGVIGADDIAHELAQVASGHTVNGKPVNVERLQPTDSFADIHELYIGLAEGRQLTAVLRRAHGQPILLVTATENALRHGSMINFRIADDRVRFEVALDPLEQAGLRISSRMLSVALQVVRTQAR